MPTTDEQVDKIILPAMQEIAKQCAGYINELQSPPEFIAFILKDVVDAFQKPEPEGDSGCSCY